VTLTTLQKPVVNMVRFCLSLKRWGIDKYANSCSRLVRKCREEIALHRAKVQNPSSVIADWESLDRRYQDGLIAHWKKEIEVFESEVAISETVLYERKQ
jgi:hypothetical protein